VPANTYSSLISLGDANQQAVNYLNANGQAYANANGTCTAPGTAPIAASNMTTNTITVGFTNNCTGQLYLFHMNGNTTANWNTVPVGVYAVSTSGGISTTSWNIDGYVQTGNSVNFSNISLNSGYNSFSAQ
jgi:hypothetical protein